MLNECLYKKNISERIEAYKLVIALYFEWSSCTSFSSHTVDEMEMRLLINSFLKMRNEYIRIDTQHNQELP